MVKATNPLWEGWTPEKDALLLKMKADKLSLREMGAELGINYSTVRYRLRYLSKQPAPRTTTPEVEAPRPTHIDRYNAARRGFTVPPHLEAEYFGLLKKGVPIVEACKRLGINVNQGKR